MKLLRRRKLITAIKQQLGLFTCSREEKAASRYFLTFFMQADKIRLRMAFGASGSVAEIAAWDDVERADKACNITSFPCHTPTYN